MVACVQTKRLRMTVPTGPIDRTGAADSARGASCRLLSAVARSRTHALPSVVLCVVSCFGAVLWRCGCSFGSSCGGLGHSRGMAHVPAPPTPRPGPDSEQRGRAPHCGWLSCRCRALTCHQLILPHPHIPPSHIYGRGVFACRHTPRQRAAGPRTPHALPSVCLCVVSCFGAVAARPAPPADSRVACGACTSVGDPRGDVCVGCSFGPSPGPGSEAPPREACSVCDGRTAPKIAGSARTSVWRCWEVCAGGGLMRDLQTPRLSFTHREQAHNPPAATRPSFALNKAGGGIPG